MPFYSLQGFFVLGEIKPPEGANDDQAAGGKPDERPVDMRTVIGGLNGDPDCKQAFAQNDDIQQLITLDDMMPVPRGWIFGFGENG